MCGYCDRNELGDVARALVHNRQDRYFLADGTKVQVIGSDESRVNAWVVREGSEGYGLTPHFAVAHAETVPFAELRLAPPAPAESCRCEPEDSSTEHGVTVGGHHEECVLGLDFPRRYIYLVEGEMCVGNLADYAKALEQAHYAGLAVSNELRTWTATLKPEITWGAFDASDYADVQVNVGNETASYRIDGRA